MSRRYQTHTGYFIQDDGNEDWASTPPHFGLKERSNERWKNLRKALDNLNETAAPGASYKLIFAGRHGQGFHNLAELKYGKKAWDEKWAKLDGDGEIVWGPDPLLTDLGLDQARDVQAMWKEEMEANVLLPDKLYCSPMTRAIQTNILTFEGVLDLKSRHPLILENCREQYGVHSCDKRRSLTYLRNSFPDFDFEEGFAEEDELYETDVRESEDHIVERARCVLDHIFKYDKEPVISITAHSGFIRGLQKAAGHALVELPTGGVLPLIVKCIIT